MVIEKSGDIVNSGCYIPVKRRVLVDFTFFILYTILIDEVISMDELMFDYQSLVEELTVPSAVIQKFEQEARDEFPNDNMLMEIHLLRAVKAYAKVASQSVTN